MMAAPVNNHFYNYFTNALMIPAGQDQPGFDVKQAPAPIDRVTNAGWLTATVEFDWENVAEFDRNLDWFAGKDGDFTVAPVWAVHRELQRHHDYRGFCAVHSGRVSVHVHYIYDTTHLVQAPYDADYQTRLDRHQEIAAVMRAAHETIWRHAVDVTKRVLQPARAPDDRLNNPVQWRRAPFGVNELEKDCGFLGLMKGQRVPQLPLHEIISDRRPRGSSGYLLDPHLSPKPCWRPRSKSKATNIEPSEIPAEALELVRQACEEEWGAPYPRALHIGFDGNEAIINFANHPGDQKPSTIVMGEFKKLTLCGENAPEGDFYLPGDWTANEFATWAIDVARARTLVLDDAGLTRQERQAVIARERQNVALHSELYLMRPGCDRLTISAEGAGKSQSALATMFDEMFDRAVDGAKDGSQHFMIYAARSTQQADDKRREYEELFHARAALLESFWTVYRRMCGHAGIQPLRTLDFDKMTANEVLATIGSRQPAVFCEIEAYRKGFWRNARYDCSSTAIFTTKATVRTWHASRLTRAWLHPSFEPGVAPEQEAVLAANFGHGCVAYDELELDEFIHVWPEARYELVKAQQEANTGWANLPRRERLDVFKSLQGRCADFDAFDADMRVDLGSLDRVEVNFIDIPFGGDNSDSGIYRRKDKTAFYLGVQDWLFSAVGNRNFLTTERLMTEVVRGAYRKRPANKARLMCKYLEPPPELFPITIDLFIDKRANARGVADLAREITDANPNAFVICNGVKDNDRVLTFQRAKGVNDLADKDVYIIVTHLTPDQYAELNVVGQWLGIPDVVDLHYRDQISQAVGRNRGFRDAGNGRKTVVIASAKLSRSSILSPLMIGAAQTTWAESLPNEESEFKKQMRRSVNLLMADNEFSARRERREHIQFKPVTARPW